MEIKRDRSEWVLSRDAEPAIVADTACPVTPIGGERQAGEAVMVAEVTDGDGATAGSQRVYPAGRGVHHMQLPRR